ncbi:sequence-specific DNA binding RNA polymerase II transcription factor [Ascochyta rabiei]|uniref:Sequence-specific DNA binding RNA polymerase II transcription factor n=1 Tax=Didymella rabiei TaxID=5454 RepID=A0A163G3V8_DIDRA|nr:sequence-specific DNA binding RNA polymerase II transcription factor [Ascochyta rabiei]
MLLNSLTYQITFDPKHAQHADEYYGRSIKAFRQALSDPICFKEEMTPYAGILLCSISMNRAMPFSIHLNGIASLFHQRQSVQLSTEDSEELASLIGVLDLPTHSLGRRTKRLDMWHNHCMGQTGIEQVTGLPCSLIDLLASPMDHDIEERLLQWPVELGEPATCRIWEAAQYAGLIMIRQYRLDHGLPSNLGIESYNSIGRHLLTLLRDLRMRMDVSTFVATEALLFPLVAVGSQPAMLTAGSRAFILECIVSLANDSLSDYPYYRAVVAVLETLWAGDGTKSLDNVTREMDLELALF